MDKLAKHKGLVKFGIRKAEKLKLKTLAKFGRKHSGITKEEISALGDEKALPKLISIGAHAFTGNAPFGPDTAEYKAFMGTVKRADKILRRVKPDLLQKIVPEGQTLADVAEPFIYNNRTGDDDHIVISL